MGEKVLVDGAVTEGGMVSLDDRGLLLGDGLFETVPLFGGRPFRLDRHLARLRKGAGRIGIVPPFADSDVAGRIAELAALNGIDGDGVVRLTLTRGSGPRGYGSAGCHTPAWIMTVRRRTVLPEAIYQRGYRLVPLAGRRCRNAPTASLKSTSSLERVLAMDEAVRRGGDEGLVHTDDGYVSGCVAANLFWISQGTLFTPARTCAILPGVTREAVIDLARDGGIAVDEGEHSSRSFLEADEAFCTSSLLGIMPVGEVADLFARQGAGELTRHLMERYGGVVREETGG